MLSLALTAFFVGALIGMVGIGGILLIPAITAFAGMEVRQAMATALFSFIFTAVVGTWLFHRRGSIDWVIAVPICAGALLFGYLGALANAHVDTAWLNMALALVIVFAGAYVLLPHSRHQPFAFDRRNTGHLALLGGIGGAVGFVSGLTGVGGPVLSVPIMVVLGFAPLTAIATGQVIQVAAACSGTVGNLVHGFIDFGAASWLTVVQLAGLILGVRFAHSFGSGLLRRMVAVVCLGVGGFLFARSVARVML
uniref:Probable membrane transporter protein n=1 Tax=Fundidesulfovibrio putealis TaxID=270496 RepID=A0A7C4EJH7_9BACT